jgi:putative SOS response-associated peptidase YedK
VCPVLSLKEENGTLLETFTIITTDSNEIMARIHPRMPVILHSRDYDR